MMKKIRAFLFILSFTMIYGCSAKLPLIVKGSLPSEKPKFHKFYRGENLSRSNTSMVVGADSGKQASLYIIKVDDIRKPGGSLIGGPKAAIVLPGIHDITVQLRDRKRLTIPLVLKGLKLKAGVGYLINFRLNYPEKFEYISGNDKLLITITVTNLDNKRVNVIKKFNGWGKEVN